MATLISVHKATIANWERNRTTPAIQHVPAIVEFLGYVPDFAEDGFPAPFRVREGETGDNFHARLRLTRRLLGLSQRELADRLGVDPSTVSGWEAGRHQPTRRHRERIERLLVLPLQSCRPAPESAER